MTELQSLLLSRLRLEFGVDVSPADGLDGPDLDAWIDCAERDLLALLQQQHKS